MKVIHDHSTGLFHHKFCIVDGITVATGSLNWTRQAVIGNYENVIIIKHEPTVKSFEAEYDRMWIKIEKIMRASTKTDPFGDESWDWSEITAIYKNFYSCFHVILSYSEWRLVKRNWMQSFKNTLQFWIHYHKGSGDIIWLKHIIFFVWFVPYESYEKCLNELFSVLTNRTASIYSIWYTLYHMWHTLSNRYYSILSEIDNLANKTPNWKKLNEKEQEKIIDSHFVPDEVKAKYRKDPPKTLGNIWWYKTFWIRMNFRRKLPAPTYKNGTKVSWQRFCARWIFRAISLGNSITNRPILCYGADKSPW